MPSVPDRWATLVITSPPYPNNFDYADATRLEMTSFGEINDWGDLQDSVRTHLMRACTQHVASIVDDTSRMLGSRELDPIREELEPICLRLEKERLCHGGKKNYHTMIASYFLDMARVLAQLRRVVKDGGQICFVIGDSAPYGIHVPVEKRIA
jgi:DNA modification methylase